MGCTGVGALRRHPQIRWRLGADAPDRMAATQSQIVSAALELLRPGGRLIYATCSLLGEENRCVVQRILARHADVQRIPVKAI